MNPVRVLIVDDEPNVTLVLSNSLAKLDKGYTVETANSGHEALAKLQEQRYTLVLTDYKMPQLNGLDLAQAIHEVAPETQVVLMTAYGTTDLRQRADDMAIAGYLDKPFTIDQVREIVGGAVEKAQRAQREESPQIEVDDDAHRELVALHSDTGARCVLLLTAGGYPVDVVGTDETLDITSVGALVAANFMAAVELSRLLGNDSIFKSSYHEGPDYNIYSYDINGDVLLAVIFGAESRPGAVWFYTKQVATALAGIIVEEDPALELPQDLDEAMTAGLDDLFGTPATDEVNNVMSLDEAISAGLIPADLVDEEEVNDPS
jgi:CheY-like chemotaxis protein/predicted regulator of Ras-like GTPase activity (Roadblock/LC7/MglB family)